LSKESFVREWTIGPPSTVHADADLKDAFESIKKTLEESPHSPGLIVVENVGKYAGVLWRTKGLRKGGVDAIDEGAQGAVECRRLLDIG
jgi:hypothetical protein